MRRASLRPERLLLATAAALAIVAAAVVAAAVPAGSVPGRQLLPFGGIPVPEGGMLASVADNLADMPEVWAATEDGDVLPTGPTDVGVVPVPQGTAASPLLTRIPKPALPAGPRRVGIQAGHWLTEEAPPELWRLLTQGGTSWAGIREVDITLDIAERVKSILEPQGIVVDVLPTTIPPGYVADAFVALHGDGDLSGLASGFKIAHGARRTPFEAALLETIKREYGSATGLGYDGENVTRAMRSYYVFSWQRIKYSTAPHTPSVVLEMGYLSNDADRALMVGRADLVAGAIATGILRFLEAHPREQLFGEDLLVPAIPQFRRPSPSSP